VSDISHHEIADELARRIEATAADVPAGEVPFSDSLAFAQLHATLAAVSALEALAERLDILETTLGDRLAEIRDKPGRSAFGPL
jgi:hypothetical protein